jgi:methylmalonyl-CoA/ethylmalonyl-CoA epimerase
MTVASNDLSKIVHVVQNIETTAARFCGLFGIERVNIVHTSPPNGLDPGIYTRYKGRDISGRVKLANVQMGRVTMELIEPVDADSPWATFLKNHGEGIFSLVFTVTDFEATIVRLESEGMPLYHRGEYGSGRYAYFESKDQVGVTLCIQEVDK